MISGLFTRVEEISVCPGALVARLRKLHPRGASICRFRSIPTVAWYRDAVDVRLNLAGRTTGRYWNKLLQQLRV